MNKVNSASEGLEAAIQAAGGAGLLARRLGLTPGVITQWRKGRVPAERVRAISEATGVRPEDLRPDLYPAARPGLAEAQAPYRDDAAKLGLDPEAIATAALKQAVGAEKARRWAAENAAAIAAHTRYIEKHDTPLARYRMF